MTIDTTALRAELLDRLGKPARPEPQDAGRFLAVLDCLGAAEAEVERLHSWEGLMSLLDEHWPESMIPTLSDDVSRDPGPRIVSLLRWVEALRAQVERVREALDPYAKMNHFEDCGGDGDCARHVADESIRALDGEVEA